MHTLNISKNGIITVPKSISSIFKPTDKLAWFTEGDTLIIKRINPPRLSEIAARIKEKPIPLKEIVKEVHAYRKEKSGR